MRIYSNSVEFFHSHAYSYAMQSEFEFIEKIRRRTNYSSIKIGIGDDCAVISKNDRTDLVITTDLLVEDVDFRLNWFKPEFLGHKALAVSLSDIAAMGAIPVWAMLSIGIPPDIWKTDFLEKFYDGWFKLAEKFNVQLIGGDVSKTPDKIIIDSIVAGEVKKNRAILRSGAKIGDLIYVTGELGSAAVGLRLLENGEFYDQSEHKKLLQRQLAPNPQIEIGRILGENKLATAMIDLSDGLSGDLAHLCRESRVGATIYADKIPVDVNLSASLGDFSEILNGGEDFELLFTVNRKKISRLEKLLKDHPVSQIGIVTEDVDKIALISDAKIEILEPKSFRHF